MKTVGIVVEYNPFHNGHLYQLQAAKEKAQAETTICVMSGNFLQRGEPALVSKWSRTKMALLAGVDLVIELPYAFSVQKAEIFAYGAIYLLNALQCKHICFGSESGNITDFYKTLQFLTRHHSQYEKFIKEFMKKGMSYPSALSAAFQKLHPGNELVDLSRPNNILGYHYIDSASKINPHLQLMTVQRKNADYHDESFNHTNIASATSIRNMIQQTDHIQEISRYVPETTFSELQTYLSRFGQFHFWEHYWPYLQYQLLSKRREELKLIYEVEEGLENRLVRAAQSAHHFQGFMEIIKTKRYTWTRLQRTATHILMNTHKEMIDSFGMNPQYIRLLGMSRNGREYLSKIKKDLPIPLISKVSGQQNGMLALDRKATQIYAHVLQEPYRTRLRDLEYKQPPIMM
ncbi:nucleotidyltransferase [Lederbergia sp. NSJ-179]|uniref:nucleotidyltransferase n=1 Tax=Lederbergia sp. NSJ-179 TaxID=2931402 RepID=UPI001FD2BBF4|nr:nucleotidyltransferase [Lederbergia sp. NSJ-179]MCJ7839537.1 nucleotidyltransferase [Lederbergia sp. NSJ-179]